MATTTDQAILVGKESTYGTAATLTRAFEGKADTFKRQQEFLNSSGMRAGRQAQRSDRSVPINMGAEGGIEVDVIDAGFGLLFQSLLGAKAGPTQIGTSGAYTSTFTSTAEGPADSWTVQVQRVDNAGTLRPFTYKGSTITGWSLAQEVGGLLVATFNFDAQDEVTDVAAGTPTYVDGQPFNWSQIAATWNAVALDVSEFSLEANLGFKTDRRFLRGSALKKQPKRVAVPEFTGSMTAEFESLTHYNAYKAGTVAPLVFTYTGRSIGTGVQSAAMTITLPAVQFTGETPEASEDDMTTQSLPFKVLHNGTNPAVTITYTSTDAAL